VWAQDVDSLNALPQPDRRKLDESEVVGRQLVVARCNPMTVLDLVKEPLDQVAGAIEMRAEADELAAIRPHIGQQFLRLLGRDCQR